MKKLKLREVIEKLVEAEKLCGSDAEINISIQNDPVIHNIYDILYDKKGVRIYNY